MAAIAASERPYGLGHVVDESSVINGVVALLATGGSTNHTMHLVSMAAAAGIDLRWEDFDVLSTTANKLRHHLQAGTLTSVQIVARYTRQIERYNTKLRAIISVPSNLEEIAHNLILSGSKGGSEVYYMASPLL